MEDLMLLINDPNNPDTSIISAQICLSVKYSGTNIDTAISIANYTLKRIRTVLSKEKTVSVRNQLMLSRIKVLNHLGNFFETKDNYQMALKINSYGLVLQNILKEDKYLAYTLINIGNNYSCLHSSKKALRYYKKALKISIQLKNELHIARSLNYIGNVHVTVGKINRALEFYYKSLSICLKNKSTETDDVLNNLGRAYFHLREYDMAQRFFHKSLALSRKNNNIYATITLLGNIGSIYKHQIKFDTSLQYLFQSVTLSKKYGLKEPLAHSLIAIGDIYGYQGELEKSLDFTQQGLKIYEGINAPLKVAMANIALANVYNDIHELSDAKKYAHIGLKVAKELRSEALVREAALVLSKVYKTEGNSELSLFMYKRFIKARDIVNSIQAHKKAVEIRGTYKNTNKVETLEGELAHLKNKLNWSGHFYLLLYFILSLFIALGFLFFYLKKLKVNLTEAEHPINSQSTNENGHHTSITVTYGKKIKLLDLNDIIFFHSNNNLVMVNNKDGKSYVVDHALKKLETSLPKNFMRVHRSFIINTSHIKEIKRTYNGKVVFTMNGESEKEIPSSVSYSHNVKLIKAQKLDLVGQP